MCAVVVLPAAVVACCYGGVGALQIGEVCQYWASAYSVFYWAVQWSWFAWVNALCNLSRKKLQEVTASLPGRSLSRRCFTLCITMEVEPRIAKQHKCHHCCSCKNYWGKGMEGGKKVSLSHFSADQKIVLGHPIARATGYCLLPDTFWLQASKNVC